MIEIRTSLPRAFVEGRKLVDGLAVFDDGELTEAQLGIYRRNPKFTVYEPEPSPPSLSQAIEQASAIMGPYAPDNIAELLGDICSFESTGDDVVAACRDIMNDPAKAEMMAGDKPTTKALSDILGRKVSAAERDAACDYILSEEDD